MAISRRCPRCQQLFQGRVCNACAAKWNKKRQDRAEGIKMYSKRRWKECRRDVRLKWLDYDIWALGEGRLVKLKERVVVHHIRERNEAPELAYDLDNLITVSYDSHAEIHKLYETDRQAALERIQRGMKLFKEMMAG